MGGLLPEGLKTYSWLPILSTLVIAYAVARCIYFLHFHPLSKFPGPKLAAVSNVWYAYYWLQGRWPWAIQATLKKYGHIVRIAPNELVFDSPQASKDIYGSHDKGLEIFTKTDIHDFGRDRDGGLIWQQDPVKHHQIAKQLAPAFSLRAIRAKDGVLHKHVDYFVEKMKEKAASHVGVDLAAWVQWLSLDIAADMAYHHEANCMRDEQDSPYLRLILRFNKLVTVTQVLRRFPWLSFLRFFGFSFSLVARFLEVKRTRVFEFRRRLSKRGTTEHVDYFEQLIQERTPDDGEELTHLSTITTQLMFAGYLPPSDWYYGILFHLLQNEEVWNVLTQEIRHEFKTYNQITPGSSSPLPYLNACMKEALRLFNTSATINGMPVCSPGATVDGSYIPKGTVCQFSIRSVCRNPRYFKNPEKYRPERWLPSDHALYNPIFANDTLDAFSAFSQGPRVCVGKEVAWWQGRLVIAKILWSFDIRMLPGQHVDMEKDLRSWGYWEKPGLTVRFLPVRRSL
ncbi:cytochrome P450 [Nemania sp. NC0429]|nr:cytochrome P450 [Nemania sp. NC0429]